MQSSNLEIVITAKDEASAKVSTFGQKLKDLQPAFKTMAVAGGIAFASITAFANESIKAAQESELVQAQLGAVLKSTAGVAGITAEAAIDLSKALQRTTTYSDEAILSTQNLLLTFTKIGKDVMPTATETVLDMATALGTDTKSAAIQVGKALQDPIKGISALSRVGVNFSEEQKALIQRLVDTGQSLEAQKLILKELNVEFGGSASAAANTYAGRMTQLKNQINEVQESIGNALIPILNQVVTALMPVITATVQWVEAHPELTRNILLVGGAVSALVLAIGALGLILPSIIAFFGLLSPTVLVVGGIIAGLIVIVKNVIAIFKLFRDDSKDIWEGVKIYFKEAIDSIVKYFKPLIDVLNFVLEKIAAIAAGVKNVVSGAVSSGLGLVTGRRAQGGNVMRGSTYLVGESGPEYFTPTGSGMITANNRIGAGAGSITVNINGGTYLSPTVAQEIGDMIIEQFKKVARI